MALNRAVIMGRLTRDPELRKTENGTSVASITLAVERSGKDKGTDFLDVVCWRQTAEFVSKYFSKGRMAIVEGRLQVRDWKDKNGNNRKSVEIIADSVFFGDSKHDAAQEATTPANAEGLAQRFEQYGVGGFAEVEDDGGELPF